MVHETSQKFFATSRLTDNQEGSFVLRCGIDLGAQFLQRTADANERLRSRPHHFHPVLITGLPEMIEGGIDCA